MSTHIHIHPRAHAHPHPHPPGILLLADALKTNGTLLHLDVRGNSIRNDGAIALGALLKVNCILQSCSLEWNCVGIFDSGMHALAESLTFNQTLQSLDLRNNKVSGTGAAMLAKALRHNTALRRLDLRWNAIGTTGARAFIDLLKVNIVLHELELTGNDVSEDALRAVTASLLKNAERHRLDVDTRAASAYLSSALQAITADHAHSLSALAGRLGEAEEQGKTLTSRLQVASEEITGTQDAYKVLLAKWELVRRQKADLEAAVMEERKEMATLTSGYQRDLLNEREVRLSSPSPMQGVAGTGSFAHRPSLILIAPPRMPSRAHRNAWPWRTRWSSTSGVGRSVSWPRRPSGGRRS
jgi:hypothetical protein